MKAYLYKQSSKILKGHVNIKDFIFAKEVRLGSYISIPPAALVSMENAKKDPMLAPKFQERVKYIVILAPIMVEFHSLYIFTILTLFYYY